MEPIGIYLLVLLLMAVLVVLAVVLVRYKGRQPTPDLMLQQIDSLREQVRQNLDSTTQNLQQQFHNLQSQILEQLKTHMGTLQNTSSDMNTRLDNAARVIMDVKKELGAVKETVRAVGDIKDILKAPKLRGGFGEFFLGDLLSQILPTESFILQYEFPDGQKVDAVVKLGDKFVPIDSKFPLENFKKAFDAETEEAKKVAKRQLVTDVKKHIDGVAKYIRSDEGTYDFALMYICAENIYYEIAIGGNIFGDEKPIISYALSKKVFPVSPNTLYTYLYTIILGLKGLQIEKHAEEVMSKLSRLQKEFVRFHDDFAVLGKHIGNARSVFDKADKRLTRIEERFGGFLPEAEVVEALPEVSNEEEVAETVIN